MTHIFDLQPTRRLQLLSLDDLHTIWMAVSITPNRQRPTILNEKLVNQSWRGMIRLSHYIYLLVSNVNRWFRYAYVMTIE